MKKMKNLVVVSEHIRDMINAFGTYFEDTHLTREECLNISRKSNFLHRSFVKKKNVEYYFQHIDLSYEVYDIMVKKINNKHIINDIIFCGMSERSWKQTSDLIYHIFDVIIHEKILRSIFYLHEIKNGFYIDTPLLYESKLTDNN